MRKFTTVLLTLTLMLMSLFVCAQTITVAPAPASKEINLIPTTVPIPVPATPTYPNGVRTAAAFLSAGQFFALHCNYNLTVDMGGNTETGVEGEFVLFLLDMKIHYFTSGGRVIVGWDDEPLDGFPFYSASKVKNLNIWVQSAEGKGGDRPVYGYYNALNVSCASPIVVTLYPQSRLWMVGFDSDNPNVALRFTNGGGPFDYDPDLHSFKVWIDPTVPQDYEIYNKATGIVLKTGTLTYGQTELEENKAALNVTYVNGVKEIFFRSRQWAYLHEEQFSSTDEAGQSANVYMVDPGSLGVDIQLSNLSGHIILKGFDQGAGGVIRQTTLADFAADSENYYGIHVPPGTASQYILVITGQTGYDLNAYQTPDPSPLSVSVSGGRGGGGGVGGKG